MSRLAGSGEKISGVEYSSLVFGDLHKKSVNHFRNFLISCATLLMATNPNVSIKLKQINYGPSSMVVDCVRLRASLYVYGSGNRIHLREHI